MFLAKDLWMQFALMERGGEGRRIRYTATEPPERNRAKCAIKTRQKLKEGASAPPSHSFHDVLEHDLFLSSYYALNHFPQLWITHNHTLYMYCRTIVSSAKCAPKDPMLQGLLLQPYSVLHAHAAAHRPSSMLLLRENQVLHFRATADLHLHR